ncbi:hypothetical protein [Ferrimonas balearica]|uniref:hypothetical protein n=1 Tax=Ferrimonas balearica TaxID=44012 RepID=UPI001C99D759|nr:hypothetical protein [Ferrimonas balearica]MBY5923342.1 hypothetical protein [Ferrimonas balearica]MBY5995300.1 hypothetical protein [Ferrimonas balearica]
MTTASASAKMATLLLIPPAGQQGEELLLNYLALAATLDGKVAIHWAGYQQRPNQVAFKSIPDFLLCHPGTTVISHCPLPETWPLAGARVILTLLPQQLRGLSRRSPVEAIWVLDGCELSLWDWLRIMLWHRPRPHPFSLWVPEVEPDPSLTPGYLFALSSRLSPAERELVSEVAQVVAIKRQCPTYLWMRGSSPPSLRGVTVLPADDEPLLIQHLNVARGVISDSWHRLLTSASARRPTLALTEHPAPLYRAARRAGIESCALTRQGLTQAVLNLTQVPRVQPENQCRNAAAMLWPDSEDALGSDALSGYTSP